jgi:hypothetical protein
MLREGVLIGLKNAMIGLAILVVVFTAAAIAQKQPYPKSGFHYPNTFRLYHCGNECNK